MTWILNFTVHGEARPAGSKRAFALRRRDGTLVTRPGGAPVINVTDDNPKSKDWKGTVAWAAREAVGSGFALLHGPLVVTFSFYRTRPKGHLKPDGLLAKSGRDNPYPTTKPDVLKLARGAEDALTGVLWRDDAQIVKETLEKNYGNWARLEVTVEALDG